MLLGFALRLPSATQQLEYDEVISMLFARLSLDQMVSATAADTMPPLYYGLLHFWTALGDTLFIARLLSTVIGTLTIPALYLLGGRLLERRIALTAAALVAVSPVHVFYGHYVRMYGLLLLLGLLASYFFVRWLQDGRKRDVVCFTLCAGASLYVHNLAVLLIMSLDLLWLMTWTWRRGGQASRIRTLAAMHAGLFIVYLPWLTYLPGQLDKVARAFWIPVPGLTELVRTAIVFHFHLPLPPASLGVAAFLSLLLILLTGYEARRRWRAEPAIRASLLALAALAVVPIALMFLVSQVRPIYVERALLTSSAAYYLLLAAALAWLPVRRLAFGLSIALCAGVVLANLHQYRYQEFPRSPLYEVGSYLAQETGPADYVLHDNKLSFFPVHFFQPTIPQGYIADPPGSPNDTLAPGTQDALGLWPTTPEEAVKGHKRLWLVLFQRALRESEQAGTPLPSKLWLEQHYPEEARVTIGDVELYLYRVEP